MIKKGNKCTVIWYDSRDDRGICTVDLCELADIDDTYLRFASAKVVPEDKRICDLTGVIGEAVNVTIRIITANIDPESIAEYCSVPTMFGGAGTGCVSEILLFNPCDKYLSPKERIEYTNTARLQLKMNGLSLSEIMELQQADGRTVLIQSDII